MQVWVQAVNQQGEFGVWVADVAFDPAKLRDIIMLHGAVSTPVPAAA
jgi:type III restriction enzyme